MKRNNTRDSDDEPAIQTVAEPLQQYLQKNAASAPAAPQTPSTVAQPQAGNDASRVLAFRPTHRQPLALLTILDDGSRDEGESIRIRDAKYAIGREEGHLTLPFDPDISREHAELRCQHQKGRFRWYLIDKKSTNGTFVRAFRASLSKESELIIGGRRYLFRLPEPGQEATETKALQTQAYRAPSRTILEQFVPRLTEAGVAEQAARSFAIGGKETHLGSDSACQIVIQEDPFVSPRHARFYQDESGRWMIEDQRSVNGIWIRIKRFAIDKQTEFQLGQQRFRFLPSLS